MQPENSFDKLSKRLAVAVSRRSLLRSLSLAVAGSLLPWKKASADDKHPTLADVETRFFADPVIVQPSAADPALRVCIVSVRFNNSEKLATLTTSASKDGECPADAASYFEKPNCDTLTAKQSLFDKAMSYNVKSDEGRSRIFKTHPTAFYYPVLNSVTGKQEFEAFCQSYTYLDPRVHKSDSDRKMILYKRMPTTEKLTSMDDDVTCGDINYAYENEIKTRMPIALRDFTVDAVPHQESVKRVNASVTSTSNHSGHKSK
jgi:hypothetical protein